MNSVGLGFMFDSAKVLSNFDNQNRYFEEEKIIIHQPSEVQSHDTLCLVQKINESFQFF